MDLRQTICDLLKETGPGRIMSVAYDTGWVARLAELGEPLGEQALEWLRAHQLPDGSWGAVQPHFYHDRLICTLAAVTALARQKDNRDRGRLQRAQLAFETSLAGLPTDHDTTVGFEMIAPTLVAEAEAWGVIQRKNHSVLDELSRRRAAKLAKLPKGMVSRFVTAVHSAEMAGADGLHLLDIPNLHETNGSVGYSPAATAYFVLTHPQDTAALNYLRQVAAGGDGGVPVVAPFDIFEQSWVLWNLALAGPLDEEILAWCQPHLNYLQAAWKPGEGVGWTVEHPLSDSDDTSVTFEVLTRMGRSADMAAILRYEEADRFRLYALETHPCLSAQAHILSALRQGGLAVSHPSVQKVLQFLRQTQTLGLFWFDKLHASPYYTTAHAVIACAGYANELVAPSVDWILDTQNLDGSWGYHMPTAEETAYSLQALIAWKRQGGRAPRPVLERGATWLREHAEPPYPPLWIDKCLYCPVVIVRSTVLSALMLAQQEL